MYQLPPLPASPAPRRAYSPSRTGGNTSHRPSARPHSPHRSSATHNGGGHSRGSYSSRPSHHGGSHRSASGSRGGHFGGGAGRGRGRQRSSFDVALYINKNPVTVETETAYVPTHTFNDFGLAPEIVRAVHSLGIEVPSAIQDQTIMPILEGKDVIGLAQTGTGKTAAFLLPIIHHTLRDRNRVTLILTPTRELAIQIEQELRKLTPHMKLFSTVCVGGANIRPQIAGLKRKNNFIIGTPGRVQDLMERGFIDTTRVTTAVLDEADRMLDMGFIHDMKTILKDVPENAQTLFFSATMSKSIEGLVHEFLNDPLTVSVRKKDITAAISQDVVRYDHAHKFDLLVTLLGKAEFTRVIVFGAMKHSVEKLGIELSKTGIPAESIHGNKSHGQRQRALTRFKSGEVKVLVATDVAARGIHVDNVSHVINYDLPGTYEDYVHRIGRTGRGDKRGSALTFVPNE